MIKSFLTERSGATAIEYGLVASLIAIGVAAALSNVGERLSGQLAGVSSALGPAESHGVDFTVTASETMWYLTVTFDPTLRSPVTLVLASRATVHACGLFQSHQGR